jgi:hypothetical protein
MNMLHIEKAPSLKPGRGIHWLKAAEERRCALVTTSGLGRKESLMVTPDEQILTIF